MHVERELTATWVQGGGMRSRLVSLCLLLVFASLICKGGAVALSGPSLVNNVPVSSAPPPVRRADIVDRHGRLLATSVTVYSVFADPREMGDAPLIARELASVLPDLDEQVVAQRLSDPQRAFVWIARQLTPRQARIVRDLGLEGIGFRKETRRAYPEGTLAGHILGYTGADEQGLDGIEYALDERLATGGAPVSLTIDANVQFALEAELSAAINRHGAQAGAGIVIEAQSGEVLGMASWPLLDPHHATKLARDDPALLNRASNAVYELGSVFKPLTLAGALDTGSVDINDRFNVQKPLVVKGQRISDDHPLSGLASPSEIITHSSNIGTVKIASQMGVDRHEQFLDLLDLLERAPIELQGSASPLTPPRFNELSSATIGYGYGLAVSPLALASAYTAFANSGEMRPPTLLKTPEHDRPAKRVMSAATAHQVTAILRQAVLHGTGNQADIGGYRVAGKTGTAEKPVQGSYSTEENICSFAAIFPADRPEYVVMIMLDTPKATVTGGRAAAWNAAPAAGRVIERIAPLLGVEPDFDNPDDLPHPIQIVSTRKSTTL